MHVTLLQPGHLYGGRQTYLPGSLLNLGSRLIAVGVSVSFFDLNHNCLADKEVQKQLHLSDRIGITVLGTPYIPTVRELIVALRKSGYQQPIMVGGEGVIRLTRVQFNQIFQRLGTVWQVTDDEQLGAVVNKRWGVPSMYEVSMVPMLRQLSNSQLEQYLKREFCLFIGQGCKFNCDFCAAAKGQKEQYRSLDALAEELRFIAKFLFGRTDRMWVYLSNLDILQTPDKFEEALYLACRIAGDHSLRLEARGLATTRCTVQAIERDPRLLRRLRSYGLSCIGFGVDGADEETWRRVHKNHNTLPEIERAVQATQDAGIKAELLIVMGFGGEDARVLWRSIRYGFEHALRGTRVRPYLAKEGAPGSAAWDHDEVMVERFLKDPELFRCLDYAMLGSSLTHPDSKQRRLTNAAYLALLFGLASLGSVSTFPLLPPDNGWRGRFSRLFNYLMPPDR